MEITVKTAKSLADSSRMRIVAALMHSRELCVCQLTELLSFAISTVSRHISLLQDAGLLKSRKEGRWVYYRLSEEIPSSLKSWLEKEVFESSRAQSDRRKLDKILFKDPAELCCNLKEKK